MKNTHLFYANGNFDNKGCEAIVRGATQILEDANGITVSTTSLELDKTIIDDLGLSYIETPRIRSTLFNVLSMLLLKLGFKKASISVPYPTYKKIGKKYKYTYSMGGDNYCYSGQEIFYRINRNIRKGSSINVFWACSIGEEYLDSLMIQDLKGYDYILPRESITFDSLKKAGFTNIIQCTDPAFTMKKKSCRYPGMDSNYIGINISPLTLSCNKNPDEMFNNLIFSIREILQKTKCNVLLIPHVYGQNGDYLIHKRIASTINDNRIILLEEKYDAEELKYIISKSEMFIGARTHATIAAYSSCVPTIVLGYSVKANGIAKDLFGTDDGYVLRVQNSYSGKELADFFIRFYESRNNVKKILNSVMPDYISNAYNILKILK